MAANPSSIIVHQVGITAINIPESIPEVQHLLILAYPYNMDFKESRDASVQPTERSHLNSPDSIGEGPV